MIEKLRNIAIIAHVDHGKTTLVDRLLQETGAFGPREAMPERAMDSNALERERGITILSKNTAIRWRDYRINVVDTPGHADFGGEVERVLSMVDAVLLLVDAVEGPMPQTRFVTSKAFAHGLRPIVVINKMDRSGARPDWVMEQTFDLMDGLGASDAQLDFPVVYCSALEGLSGREPGAMLTGMTALFETVVEHCPAPSVEREGPLRLQISALDYSSFVGAIGIGRVSRGVLRRNQPVAVVARDGSVAQGKINQVFGFIGLERVEVAEAEAGDIVAFSGIDRPGISDTLCDPARPEAMTPLTVDEPTIAMTIEANTSPFAGREGQFVTSRQLAERLQREAIHNVALRVEPTDDPDKFRVSGRGELHLAILIETMRREGYELAVSRPSVILKESDGQVQEPYEQLVVDIEVSHQGVVMEALGTRGAQLADMRPEGHARVRLDYLVPSRGLIGFQSKFRSMTSGSGVMHHIFDHYGPTRKRTQNRRSNGVLIANGQGKALAYALFNLQERGRLLLEPGEEVYEGQVVGIHTRKGDLTVNPMKAKQLTNIRAAGKDDNVLLSPAVRMTLEQGMTFLEDDELMEVTPSAIRFRKRHLSESERKRQSRQAEKEE